jgi:esterase
MHGFLGSLDNWRAVSKRLSGSCKIYSIDLRNHGESPHSEVMSYPIMAEDLREFFTEHNIFEANLLGHSMGGKVAMQFAVEHPEQVDKLIVVDIAPKAYPSSQRSLLQALRGLDLPTFKSFGEIDTALAPSIRNPILRQFLLKNITRDPVMGFRWKIDLDALIENYDELTKSIVIKGPYNKPICFIRGGHSKYIQDEDLPLIKQMFPQAKISTIPSAGHWVQAEAPEEFLQIVNDFLVKA